MRAVKLITRCAEKQSGLTRARLLYMAADDLVNEVLASHPDEDLARSSRAQARTLIYKAMPLAKPDGLLVQHLNDMLDQLP